MNSINSIFEKGLRSGEYQEENRVREIIIEGVAGRLHDTWREPRRLETGGFEPRIKRTEDKVWIEAHGGADTVDIANTNYPDLPSDWQNENRAAAMGIVNTLLKAINHKGPLEVSDINEWMSGFQNNAFIDMYGGTEVHDQWRLRNDAWAPVEQKVPFSQLSVTDQKKDIDIVHVAAEEGVSVK